MKQSFILRLDSYLPHLSNIPDGVQKEIQRYLNQYGDDRKVLDGNFIVTVKIEPATNIIS